MKKILFICNYKPNVGGISGQVEILLRHLCSEGYIADIFSTKESLWRRMFMPFRLWMKARGYDTFHIHCCSSWGFFPAVLGVFVGKMIGKRIVLSYHGGEAGAFFAKYPRFVRYWLLRTDANIALSGFVGKEFDRIGVPYTIIPNILDFEETKFRKRDILHPAFICIRAHEVLYNIPCILRAFQIVLNQMPKATLTLVGDGSQHELLLQMVEKMRLQSVEFTGHVDNSEIYKYLDNADIMISSPRIDNMPVSVLEAMNAGLLVISSNVGGIPFMIEDGKTGFLFPSNDEHKLAEQMLKAINEQEKSLQMIFNAKRGISKYNWDSIRDKIIQLYE